MSEFKIGDAVETVDRALWSMFPARGVVKSFDNLGPNGSQRIFVRFENGRTPPLLPHEIKRREKGTYEEMAAAWEAARQSATSRDDFQVKWTAALERLGWTRQEFHAELDRRSHG